MTRPSKCKFCNEVDPNHWPFQCFKNPKRKSYKIPKMGKIAFASQATRRVWFNTNPPDESGYYYCYLGISNLCPGRLLPFETTLDHVMPKGSNPNLRNDLLNLMPCCYACNTLKGSRSLEEALKLKNG